MNNISIFTDENYLIFTINTSENEQHTIKYLNNIRFPLYFFLDKIQAQISFNSNFKYFYLSQNKNFIGDFWQKATNDLKYTWENKQFDYSNLLVLILNKIKQEYFEKTKQDESETIPVKIIYSDNFKAENKNYFQNILLEQNFELQEQNLSFSELIIKNYIAQNDLFIQNQKFAVIEALENNLNISIVQVTDNEIEQKKHESFNNQGITPLKNVIAKEIVDDINRSAKIKDKQHIEFEYRRHEIKVEKIISTIQNPTQLGAEKKIISISTNLSENIDKRYISKLNIDEINKLAELQSKKIVANFTDNFGIKSTELTKIFLIGNSLNSSLIKKEFENFGKNKIIYFTDDISLIVKLVHTKPATEELDDEATMFLATEDDTEELQIEYNNMQTVQTSEIKNEQYLKLSNLDSRTGKGESTQVFRCISENKFVVIESTRSLKKDDIIEPITTTWHQGIQIMLKIYRKNKYLGKFKTREIQKIEISN